MDNMQPREIVRDLKIAGTPVDEELVVALSDMFPGPKVDKGGKTLDLEGITDLIKRLWPDRKPPPTPPETEQELEQKEDKKDDKKTKDKK